ncbi:MAG: hypothetical protein HQL50_08685 [Magnetococcales bacterium]|nr:hypothetical protein [Magnetococcales bacterium]
MNDSELRSLADKAHQSITVLAMGLDGIGRVLAKAAASEDADVGDDLHSVGWLISENAQMLTAMQEIEDSALEKLKHKRVKVVRSR